MNLAGSAKNVPRQTSRLRQLSSLLSQTTCTLVSRVVKPDGDEPRSGCLNFDQGKKVVKMSREFLYKEIHVIFWRLFCVSQNSNNVPDILTPPQNSPTTAVYLDMHNCSVILHSRHPRCLANLFKLCSKRY